MVKDLDIFRNNFRQFEGFFTLDWWFIGCAACVEGFEAERLEFGATKGLYLAPVDFSFGESTVDALYYALGVSATNTVCKVGCTVTDAPSRRTLWYRVIVHFIHPITSETTR